MNNFDMHLQMFCFRKRFPTEFTFIVFVAFMKCMDMFIREIGGGSPLRLKNPKKQPPPETLLKSSGIATTLKPNSNPPKNFRDRPP